MTKTKPATAQAASKRTDPLDRDGDGHPGGSLPGNQTAPYAEGEQPDAAVQELAEQLDLDPALDGAEPEAAKPIEEPEQDGQPEPGDTFTPEEIAAGKTPVIEAEGEQVATAADATATAELARVDLDTAPGDQPRTVAVNVEQLRLLAQNKWLYKSDQGFGAASGAPFVDQATVDVWIDAGLCTWSATAGNHGGVRITHEGRRVLGVAQRAA